MFRRLRKQIRNQQGGVLAFVAAALGMILGMSALAVDLGMLYTAQTEAQRAADAAALAGASVWIEPTLPTNAFADSAGRARAIEYATLNTIREDSIVPGEVDVAVYPDSMRVEVTIRRTGIDLWFASILGIDQASVAAHAAAKAFQAGEALCLKPFAVPDVWYDPSDDKNDNLVWDKGEDWDYLPDEEGDIYKRYQDVTGAPGVGVEGAETGWGSDFRNEVGENPYVNDFGRQIVIKAGHPQEETPQPGFFYPWVLPETGRGGDEYRESIATCRGGPVPLDATWEIDEETVAQDNEPGNMVGPTKQGITDLVNQDPDATWEEFITDDGHTSGRITYPDGSSSPYVGNPLASPRVITLGLFDPGYVDSGRTDIRFNNFAKFFLVGMQGKSVVAHFMGFVSGSGDPGPTTGSLVRIIRLVE